MPNLKYKLLPGETLVYLQSLDFTQTSTEESGELSAETTVSVGEDGVMRVTSELLEASGSLPDDLVNSVTAPRPRQLDTFGQDVSSRPALPFFPVFLEESVSVGDQWSIEEAGPNGEHLEVVYHLVALEGDIAEIVSQKQHEDDITGTLAAETQFEFSLSQGRVLRAETMVAISFEDEKTEIVTESVLQVANPGPSLN